MESNHRLRSCGVCKETVGDNDDSVLCDAFCKKRFHVTCVKFTIKEFEFLKMIISKVKWYCDDCSRAVDEAIKDYEKKSERNVVSVLSVALNELDSVLRNNILFSNNIDKLFDAIRNLKNLLKQVKKTNETDPLLAVSGIPVVESSFTPEECDDNWLEDVEENDNACSNFVETGKTLNVNMLSDINDCEILSDISYSQNLEHNNNSDGVKHNNNIRIVSCNVGGNLAHDDSGVISSVKEILGEKLVTESEQVSFSGNVDSDEDVSRDITASLSPSGSLIKEEILVKEEMTGQEVEITTLFIPEYCEKKTNALRKCSAEYLQPGSYLKQQENDEILLVVEAPEFETTEASCVVAKHRTLHGKKKMYTIPSPSSLSPFSQCDSDKDLEFHLIDEDEEEFTIIDDISDSSHTDISFSNSRRNEIVSPKSSRRVVRPSNPTVSKRIREKNYCLYCQSLVLNYARHIQRSHRTELAVQEIISKPPNSSERKSLISALRKKGNYVLNSKECRKPVKKIDPRLASNNSYLPCSKCLGFYARKQLWRHKKKCLQNLNEVPS